MQEVQEGRRPHPLEMGEIVNLYGDKECSLEMAAAAVVVQAQIPLKEMMVAMVEVGASLQKVLIHLARTPCIGGPLGWQRRHMAAFRASVVGEVPFTEHKGQRGGDRLTERTGTGPALALILITPWVGVGVQVGGYGTRPMGPPQQIVVGLAVLEGVGRVYLVLHNIIVHRTGGTRRLMAVAVAVRVYTLRMVRLYQRAVVRVIAAPSS